MQYLVKALKPGFGVSVLTLEAADANEATLQAQAQGCAVLSVSRASLGRERTARFPLLLFSQELLSLLDSGISIVEAIETLAEKENRPAVRQTLEKILTALREGQTLSAALEKSSQTFPPLYVATIRASEQTSSLSEALSRYVVYASQLDLLRSRLVSAAIYPVLLVGVGGLVILFLMGYVVPRFSHIYEDMGGDLPLMSRLLMQWGLLVEQYWPALIVGAGLLVAALASSPVRTAMMRWLGRLAWRIPSIGEHMRVFQLARLYRTLGMLLRGGVSIVPALDMVSGLLSPVLRGSLVSATTKIREGVPTSEAFEKEALTTAVALRMLRVGERAGNMGDMMERVAAFHDEETARWAEWATRLFGPILMLLMGLVIGVIVVLMYMPIFQLAENIQ